MCVTHSSARGRIFSSPMANEGLFFEEWSKGDTDAGLTAWAPSWEANPSVDVEYLHKLFDDPRVFEREAGARFGAGVSDALDPVLVHAAVRHLAATACNLGPPICVLDPSGGRGDGYAWAVVRYMRENGRKVLHISDVGCLEGKFFETTPHADVVAHIAALMRRRGCMIAHSDQWEAYATESAFRSMGLAFESHAWSQVTKIESLSSLRRMLRDGAVAVEPGDEGDKLAKECLSLREVLLPSKVYTVAAKRTKGHADRSAVLLLAARLASEGAIPGAHLAAGTNVVWSDGSVADINSPRWLPSSWSDSRRGSSADYPEPDRGQLMKISGPGEFPPRYSGGRGGGGPFGRWKGWMP